MHTAKCSRHQFQVMSVCQLGKRREDPQTSWEGPGRCIGTLDMLTTPQSAHKGGSIEVKTVMGRPTTSMGCPTLHDFAKCIMQCPTTIKDIPYTPQSLAVGQATCYLPNQHYLVGHPRDERDIPSDTLLARKCINAGLHPNTAKEMRTFTGLQYKKVRVIVRIHNYKVTYVVNLTICGALLVKVLVLHNCLQQVPRDILW
jgi:hypothetical protein